MVGESVHFLRRGEFQMGRKILLLKNHDIGFTKYMKKIAVMSQGYVRLPLAIEFAQYFPVVGYEINPLRISELEACLDVNIAVDITKLKSVLSLYKESRSSSGYMPTSDEEALQDVLIYIITVPTTIDQQNSPDLFCLLAATEMVAKVLKNKEIVIYESTVSLGCTEEECLTVLSIVSKRIFNQNFFVEYSPERMVPGDKVRALLTIIKVTSGSSPEIAEEIDQGYKVIEKAGTHKAPCIEVAEASKSIENAQRNVNTSFVNELELIFDRMEIHTNDVLDTADTKFSFFLDSEKYRVVDFDHNNRVVSIEQKPKEPKSNYANPGLYFYDNNLVKIAKNIKPSPKGESKIPDVNKEYLKQGKLKVQIFDKCTAWLDTITNQPLRQAGQFVQVIKDRQGMKIGAIEEVAYRRDYVDKEQLAKVAEPLKKSGYGGYLFKVWR